MTTSTLPSRYRINGLIDTKRAVMDNLESMCNSCGVFMSYDIHQGKWGIIINKAETTVAKAFDNSNIIGPVQVQGTSILNLYNKVRVEYTLRDTADEIDFVEYELPDEDRYPNEPDNVLQLRLDMCNEPVQAQIIGLMELKQARVDEIVTFQSDYSILSLNAGDIITLTHDLYQFTNKPFRVITLSEVDSDDGSIRIEIVALAYDANIYSTADLNRYVRSDRNGITGIGSIGQPLEPVLYVFQQSRTPGIKVEAVIPAGIVESLELWLSSDNSNFIKVSTSVPEGGGTFDTGAVVTFDYAMAASQNIYVKVRGMNSTTTGPFSVVDSFLSYVPVQATDAVTNTTAALDENGNVLNTLGMAGLVKLLDNLIANNDSGASGGVYDKVFSTYEQENGINLAGAAVMISNGIVSIKDIIVAPTGRTLLPAFTTPSFPAVLTGSYKVDVIVDQNSSGARGAVDDYIGVAVALNDVTTGASVNVDFVTSGGEGTWYWNDYAMTMVVNLVKDRQYRFTFSAANDTVSSGSGADASFDLGISIYSFVQ